MSLQIVVTKPADLSGIRAGLLSVLGEGDDVARRMRVGAPGSILDQFARQGTMGPNGYTPWKPSQRVLKHGGRTLVDTSAYFGGWMGGAGGVTEIEPGESTLRVAVGVETAQFPQAAVFQADSQVGHVAPRPLSVGSELLQDIGARLLAHVVGAAT